MARGEITRPECRREGLRRASHTMPQEWVVTAPALPTPSPRPACTTDVRAVVKAIFHPARSGCPWRLPPKAFPPYRTAPGCPHRRRNDATWQTADHQPVMLARGTQGRRDRQPIGKDRRGRRSARRSLPSDPIRGMPARRSSAASGISRPTPQAYGGCRACRRHPGSHRRPGAARGDPTRLSAAPRLGPIFADGPTRATSSRTRSRGLAHGGWRPPAAATPRTAFVCRRADGRSRGASLGRTAIAGRPRTSRSPSRVP